MSTLLALFILMLLSLALIALWLSQRLRSRSGLPAGEVVYSDMGGWQRVEAPLISRQHGLIGKPDYLVQVREQGRQRIVPVEVKSRRRPPAPLEGHLLQLAAYCLLVEEHFGSTPPYGLLRYADATLKIPFTTALRQQTLAAAAAIRGAQQAPDVARNHAEPARCHACGYQQACGSQALVSDP